MHHSTACHTRPCTPATARPCTPATAQPRTPLPQHGLDGQQKRVCSGSGRHSQKHGRQRSICGGARTKSDGRFCSCCQMNFSAGLMYALECMQRTALHARSRRLLHAAHCPPCALQALSAWRTALHARSRRYVPTVHCPQSAQQREQGRTCVEKCSKVNSSTARNQKQHAPATSVATGPLCAASAGRCAQAAKGKPCCRPRACKVGARAAGTCTHMGRHTAADPGRARWAQRQPGPARACTLVHARSRGWARNAAR